MKRPLLYVAPVLLGLCGALTPGAPASPAAGELVALQAGSAHLVADGEVLKGGVTLLMRDGRILSVGTEVEIPVNARVIDYGPDAVLIPGLVSASSRITGVPSLRTAAPELSALDAFDPYSAAYARDLAGGVTSTYLEPARGRLIAGHGAVVKLAGEDPQQRVLSRIAAIHGSVGADTWSTPGFWEPPVPATVDVGLGVAEPQLPRSVMGAMVALEELVAEARRGEEPEEEGPYGFDAPRELRALMEAGTPWRMRASSVPEIRSLLSFTRTQRLPLIIDGARAAGELADEIAASQAKVIVEVDFRTNSAPRNLGKGEQALWPVYDGAARLVAAGVPIAISTEGRTLPGDLRFAAALASRGGLDETAALRAVTLGAAEILGVSARVGSLVPGKDADVVVLNGPPLDAGISVLATWVDGALAWKSTAQGAVVLEVDELHVGDGEVLRPGQLLMRDGEIVEVGAQVAHPRGAVVVRGPVAMPGMVDAFGHLGLEGTSKAVPADTRLARIIAPGDFTDRRVARAGVTSVSLTSPTAHDSGSPVMVYKPAGADDEEMLVKQTAALHLSWGDRNRLKSGEKVVKVLKNAVEYDRKWAEYEKAIAAWVPPEEPAKSEGEEDEAKDEDGEDKEKNGKEEEKEDEDKKDKKKSKKDEEDADPVTGIWTAQVVVPPYVDAVLLRVRLAWAGDPEESTEVVGSLRCDALSEELIELTGVFEDETLEAEGLFARGFLKLSGEIEKDKLTGSLSVGDGEVSFEAERAEKELRYAQRPEQRREKAEDEKAPKGKPKAPKFDEKLEPLREAIHGRGAVIVEVSREDEILDCVAAFEGAGIRPILLGAGDAWRVLDEIEGRVAGILLTGAVLATADDGGLESLRNRYAEIASTGIPVAFASGAEEGAADLPLIAAYAISQGMSPARALRALTAGAAEMYLVCDRVGRLAEGLDADVLLLDGPPLEPSTSVLRAWVNGTEVR